jgi:hypothetical protein
MIYVLDNFLPGMEIDKLTMMSSGSIIPWRLSAVVGSELWNTSIPEQHNLQFTHMFLDTKRGNETMINQNTYELIEPLVKKINPDEWHRIKMNLNPAASQILEHGMHTDNPTHRKDAYTAVFYINNNNGYTIFKTGDKIQSVSNRLVVFPANLDHSGTSCTDSPMRLVINFNFYKSNIKELVGDLACH